ncbi:MAG: DUF4331 domain-containing protein [Actinomycetota bacterium]|nr:DUF4331 domain-containing protein [Actinomycetota bacterium]
MRTRTQSRLRRALAVSTAAGVAVTGAFIGSAGVANASSHREAPLIAGEPKVDNTDVYAFTSPDKTDSVTLIANWIPFEDPNGGPNFYPFQPGAQYDINIDNNGDGVADVTYRWVFADQDKRSTSTFLYNNGPVTSLDDPHLLFQQTYTLQEIRGGVAKTLTTGVAAPSDVGKASMPNYASLRDQAIKSVGGLKTFAGQADDPFFLDLRVFDLLYGANLKESGHDTLAGYNVNTIALQVPKSALALKGDAARNPVIGVWSATNKQTLTLSAGKATPTGAQVQVSRLGNPLINEVIVPAGLKDAFNSIPPSADHTVKPVVARVTSPEVPMLIQSIYGLKAPATPRNDLVEIFLTGIATKAPTLDGSKAPIQADLNSQVLNKDVVAKSFVPAEELRLNMAVPVTRSPSRLGVLAKDFQGFPNGRRLTDDVVDIELQALEGAAQTGKIVPALAAGDGVNVNDSAFSATFPYVALPHTAAVNQAGGVSSSGSVMPNGGVATGVGGSAGGARGFVPALTTVLVVLILGSGVAFLRRRREPGPSGRQA